MVWAASSAPLAGELPSAHRLEASSQCRPCWRRTLCDADRPSMTATMGGGNHKWESLRWWLSRPTQHFPSGAVRADKIAPIL